ncbi:UNVERIFIED_CONTAM: hypothetical protein PYX00_007357 [Menopon gallinae]
MKYDLKNTKVLVEASVLKKYNCTSYSFSFDGKYLLMRYDEQKRYRHSAFSKYVIYSLEKKTYLDLEKDRLQHAEWSPADHDIIYIHDNDIYMYVMGRGKYRITKTGIPGEVFNGICDWMYEEEIRERATTLAMSPDGQRLLYMTIDDRQVMEEQFMEYGEPGSLKNQYMTPVKIHYPKPGTALPGYQVFLFNKMDNTTRLMAASWAKPEGREITYGYKWVSNTSFTMTFANRVQNVTETDFCRGKESNCKKIFEDKNPHGWANFHSPIVSVEGDRFVARVRQKVGNDEYYHIHLISTDGSKRIALTNGTFMVREILKWDEPSGYVYYQASEVGQPASDHVYAVSTDGKQKPFCITCQMKSPEDIACKAAKITFNRNLNYMIGLCRGPTPLVTAIYKWKAPNELTQIVMLDVNEPLRKKLQEKLQPQEMNFKVKVTETIDADVRLYVPPGIDTTGKTKYPLIIYVYGGPDNPQVNDYFTIDISWYMTTNQSIIYGIIDGRGTGRKGTKMMYAVYRAFGTVEMDDQRTATKYLRDNLKFIDGERIGIWGWSYGGYATAKVLEDDVEGVFKCGVSVAPVSDWIYYNSGYTERYMDLPNANPKGYRNSSLLYNVENLRNKQFLLMHGTADDNVHYQHAMHLAKVLEKKNILFMQEAYPDEDHSIGNFRRHVYYTIERFFRRCFRL